MSQKLLLFGVFSILCLSLPESRLISRSSVSNVSFAFDVKSKEKNNIYEKKGIKFTTKNGLTIVYYGSRFSKKYLLDYLKDAQDKQKEYFFLSNLGFEDIKLVDDSLVIEDDYRLEDVSFCVTYKHDNLIKTKTYNTKSNRFTGYYNSYMAVIGLNLDRQSLSPISKNQIYETLEKLRSHFVRLGYVYTDIGVNFEKTESGHRRIIYNIDLGDCQKTDLEIVNGDSSLNNIIRNKCPKYQPAIFEVASNYLFIPDFTNLIKAKYKEHGYFSIKTSSYFDNYKKKIVYIINSGEKFVIDNYEIDFSNVDNYLSDNDVKKIESIIHKNKSLYNEKKIFLVKKILASVYRSKGFSVDSTLYENLEKKTVSVTFKFLMKDIAEKKILAHINCQGNSGVGTELIHSFLSKKIGDMISEDDLSDLKHDLLQTQCFSSVRAELKEFNDFYELMIYVKEACLWDFPQLQFGLYPDLNIGVSIGKKNIRNSGNNLRFFLNGQKIEGTSKYAGVSSLSLDGFLPNGNDYSMGLLFRYTGEISSDMKEKVLDQDSGCVFEPYFSTKFLGMDQHISLSLRKFVGTDPSTSGFFPLLNLKTTFLNKIWHELDYYSSFSINSDLLAKAHKDFLKQFHAKGTSYFFHKRYLSPRVALSLSSEASYIYFNDDKDPHKGFFVHQSIRGSDLGFFGPQGEKGVILGGNSLIGGQIKLKWIAPSTICPHSLFGSGLFIQGECGSIFNFQEKDSFQKFLKFGISGGIEITFMGGQINFRLYYFYPFNRLHSDIAMTKQGVNFGINFNFNFDTMLE